MTGWPLHSSDLPTETFLQEVRIVFLGDDMSSIPMTRSSIQGKSIGQPCYLDVGRTGFENSFFWGCPGTAANSRIQELDFEREGTREVIPWKHFHFLPSTRNPIISVFSSRHVFFTQKPVTFVVTGLCFKHLSISRFCHGLTQKLTVISAHVNVLKLLK